MKTTTRLLSRALVQSRSYATVPRAPSLLRANLPRINAPIRSQFQRPSILSRRFESSLAVHESEKTQKGYTPPDPPSYKLTFTCKPCQHRSSHKVTKQGYHHGTVLIQCPGCKQRHVISDHLKIFMDEASTLEDILQRTAGTDKDVSKLLKKGRLGQREGQLVGNEGEEDIEFWDDGTTTKHESPSKP